MKISKTIILVSCLAVSSVLLLTYFVYRRISPQVPTQPLAYGEFNPRLVWQFDAGEVVASSPVATDSYIYVRTQNSIYALNSETGKEQWRALTDAGSSLALAPVIHSQYLIVPEKGSAIAIFTATTGELAWRSLPLEVPGVNSSTGSIESIATNGNQVYVASFNDALTAYSLLDGKRLWVQDLFGRANPYVLSDRDQVYVGVDSTLKVYAALTGELTWQKDIVNGYVGPMLLVENILFVSDEENNAIYAFDVQNQDVLWTMQYTELPDDFEMNCLVSDDDVLYIAADRLLAVSLKDGNPIWVTKELGRMECPVFQGSSIYVRNRDTSLYLIDRNTGSELGRLQVMKNASGKHDPFRSPITANDLLIVPFGNHTIYAFDP